MQYSVAAAYATADKDRKEVLQKLLLQGNFFFLPPHSLPFYQLEGYENTKILIFHLDFS